MHNALAMCGEGIKQAESVTYPLFSEKGFGSTADKAEGSTRNKLFLLIQRFSAASSSASIINLT